MWHVTDLYNYEALPKNQKFVTSWSNRDEAFLEITLGIASCAKGLMQRMGNKFVQRYEMVAEGTTNAPLTAEEIATHRKEAWELYRNALGTMKNINMEITQNANQISSGVLTQQTSIQSQPTTSPPTFPQPTSPNKAEIDGEEEEEPTT